MPDIIENFYLNNAKKDENGDAHFLSASSLSKEECFILHAITRKYKPVKTLEVGLALAGSAVAIITGKMDSGIKEKHIAVDPHQKTFGKNVGLLALAEIGILDELNHVEAYSEKYFIQMHEEKTFFDFIFIDGNHSIGQAVTDVFLADKVLNNNGIIGVHDSLLFSTAASIKYLVIERNYKIITVDDGSIKNFLRQIKYIRKLGLWYSLNIIPQMHVSMVFLKKNDS